MQAWELYIGDTDNEKVSEVNKDARRRRRRINCVVVEELMIYILR